ncbi:MAG TPA: trypsin-like peptidase domain-containing protein [Ktedonobacteraceae bacterium]|nr:trypsin-like peptidase domain-containing protein [Ktedonobacteraceae bacterium]
MQLTQKPPARRRRFFSSPRVFLILGFVFVYFIGLTALAPRASAAALSAPGGNVADPVVRQVDIARPAIVRIITAIGGQLTVHFTSTVSATFPQNGGSYTVRISGSGAFISAHGEVLTADHVVNPPHDGLDQGLYSLAAQDVAAYINDHFQVSAPYTANDAYSLLLSGSLPSMSSYGQPSSEVYLSTSYVGQINARSFDSVPASDHAAVDRIEAASTFTAADVAIIHVDGMDNMPSIQLDDSSTVAELDNLTIIGYPGLADLSSSPTDLLTSSINKIYVSALKTSDSGSPVIQVGGNVEHGDSGGPALDAHGHIVGIVSFGYSGVDGDYGQTSFLQASSSALALLKNVNMAPGSQQVAWEQAMNDYASSDSGHWKKAYQELSNLANLYPAFDGLLPYLNYARGQAAREQSSPSSVGSGLNSVLLVALLILLLVVALGVLIFVVLRRGTRAAVVAPGTALYSPGLYQLPAGFSPVFPPVAGSSASLPNAQPIAGNAGVQPQPVPLAAAAYADYTSPEAYGAAYGQIPRTPQPLPEHLPWSALPDPGAHAAFDLPAVQTPQPGADEPVPAVASASEQFVPEQLPSSASWPAFSSLPAPESAATEEESVALTDERTVATSSPDQTSVPAEKAASSEETAVFSDMAAPAALDMFTWLAPCGHANTPGVRFCRVCGLPATSAAPVASSTDAQV